MVMSTPINGIETPVLFPIAYTPKIRERGRRTRFDLRQPKERGLMDNIDLGSLNYLAIIVGIIINQALGAAWYSALGKPWMAGVGLTMEDLEAMKGTARQWYPYVVSAVSALVFTLGLALVIQGMGAEDVVDGLILGLLAAIGFIATSYATTYSFEGRSLKIFLINIGYPVISYAIIGVLLAVWQ